VVFWNGKKNLDNFWIELRASTAANFRVRVRHGKRVAIGPVAQHGIESLGDGDNAGAERNLFHTQAAWIARTIEEFMVGEDDIGGGAQKRNAREHVIANLTVGTASESRPYRKTPASESGHYKNKSERLHLWKREAAPQPPLN
jgi:hypothetical protein